MLFVVRTALELSCAGRKRETHDIRWRETRTFQVDEQERLRAVNMRKAVGTRTQPLNLNPNRTRAFNWQLSGIRRAASSRVTHCGTAHLHPLFGGFA
jgi:hypothetical protein